MTKQEFIEKLKIAINTQNEITPETELNQIDEWDSLGMACTISMFSEEFSKNVDYSQIESVKTVAELLELAGIK